MEQAFLKVLNMSITSSYVILFVLVVRLLLKKVPKSFSYTLWSVVLFRLICPISFSSALSFLGFFKTRSLEHIPANLGYIPQSQANANIYAANGLAGNQLPVSAPVASTNPMQTVMIILSLLWITGIIGLLIYSVISYICLQRKVSTAVLVSDNIYRCENIKSPFVLGIIKPKIYLPVGLTENEAEYILMHEQTHIKRFDHIIKPAAFLSLCLHWFNPLVWMAFALMGRDMEMSCDEGVLRKMGKGIKKDYSSSLLALSIDRRMLSGSPIAFGESSARSRIKNVLNYRKPGFWVIALAIVLVSTVGIGLAANPKINKKGISFIDIKEVASAAAQKDQVIFRVNGRGGITVAGSVFGGYLGTESDNWSYVKDQSSPGLTPDLTVYINIGSNFKVNFYKSQPEIAMVVKGDKQCYYRVPKDTYDRVSIMYIARSYFIPEQIMKAVCDGKITNMQSMQDVPNSDSYKVLNISKENYYIYEKDGKYYVELPYMFISEISDKIYRDAVKFALPSPADELKASQEIKSLVEDNIAIIMSSPQESSNPNDYIKANQIAYENILKRGDDALSYMLSEFRNGNVKDDLRGQIMMRLCSYILGDRNNVSDETLLPNEWFGRLSVRNKIEVPDFAYEGNDPVQKLLYSTEVEKNRGTNGEFTIVAPHIFGIYEEGSMLKVFATTLSRQYFLYDKTLSEQSGGIIPVAITYEKDASGKYTLRKYEQARDGSEFAPSIKEFCIMPLSGKKIEGLADKMLKHYSGYSDIIELERENLISHLKKYDLLGVSLVRKQYQKQDEIIPLT